MLTANPQNARRVRVEEHPSPLASELATALFPLRRAAATAADFDLRYFGALQKGLGYRPYLLVAREENRTVGALPLALVESFIFGRFLVALPYVNTAGVMAEDREVAAALVDRAIALADALDVKHLELRHESPVEHPRLTTVTGHKVHMRLPLPETSEVLWKAFDPKVRNQIRKAEKNRLAVEFGSHALLADFYAVFARNMRDLGTPVFGRRLFASILSAFGGDAELCVVRQEFRPIAAALLIHDGGTSAVPSASSLRAFNATNANMFLYWQLLQRAIARRAERFDFGRSSPESNTYRFKRQWGAEPHAATWQYYTRRGAAQDMRLESGKYNRAVALWKRLPVWMTRIAGPIIVRGIP